jgi:hypothetical protein
MGTSPGSRSCSIRGHFFSHRKIEIQEGKTFVSDCFTIFDQREDQAAISLGIELWNVYGVDLARDTFIESLINAKGIKKR